MENSQTIPNKASLYIQIFDMKIIKGMQNIF